MNKLIIVFFCLWQITDYTVFSQIAVGQWRTHLPYAHTIMVADAGEKIYCASDVSLFSYNRTDKSIEKMSKVTGLSDVAIKAIKFNYNMDILLVAYANANIDLIDENSVYNISDIKRKQITGDKTINNIMFINNLAYLACGFGIVVLDLDRKEIKDTYFIGPNGGQLNVLETAFDGINIYAATGSGIYKADINSPNLANFQYWSIMTNIPNYDKKFCSITCFNQRLYAIFEDEENGLDTVYYIENNSWNYFLPGESNDYRRIITSHNKLILVTLFNVSGYDSTLARMNYVDNYLSDAINPKYAVFSDDDRLWVADGNFGLLRHIDPFDTKSMYPNGPFSNKVISLSSNGNSVWAASGGKNASWGNLFNKTGVYSFKCEEWKSYNYTETPEISMDIFDLTSVAIDPANSNHIYAGSYGGWGILEFINGSLSEIYNDSNSTLQTIYAGPFCKIGGMCFDRYNNLWVTNASVENPVSVRSPSGSWNSFPYQAVINYDIVANIIATQYDHKWIILPRGEGLFAFYENGTFDNYSDDKKEKFSVLDENGKIISNDIFSIAEDLDGTIWVGTNQGVVAYYNAYNVFDGSGFYAQKITIDIDGTPQYLLATETVTAIAIDGANRKWFGTEKAGVFLMSEDCTEQILHFNTENSPLLSDNITALTINNATGEVFFGTDLGIVSYRGNATEGADNSDSVYVYPNPVRENYTGIITVKGIVAGSNVKITDIGGNLVYETRALGGQAVWDGRNFSGEKISTGVYLVFCTNEDGSETNVGKLLFVK